MNGLSAVMKQIEAMRRPKDDPGRDVDAFALAQVEEYLNDMHKTPGTITLRISGHGYARSVKISVRKAKEAG